MKIKCFVDQDGYVHSFDSNDKCQYYPHGEPVIDGGRVLILGQEHGGEREIKDQFVLHNSLTELAKILES